MFIGLVFFIRYLFRKRRLGKAESPPSSPLLPAMEYSRDSVLPPSIARSISHRSKASNTSNGGSIDWTRNGGNRGLGNKPAPLDFGLGQGGLGTQTRGGTPLLSPLPPVAKAPVGNGGRERFELGDDTGEKSKIFEMSA